MWNEIEVMLEQRYSPSRIARHFNIPIEWVYEIRQDLIERKSQ